MSDGRGEKGEAKVRVVLDYVGCFPKGSMKCRWSHCDGLGCIHNLCNFLCSWAEQLPNKLVGRMLSPDAEFP